MALTGWLLPEDWVESREVRPTTNLSSTRFQQKTDINICQEGENVGVGKRWNHSPGPKRTPKQ
eukprot:6489381-Amphidinium_carterae.1